jgi:hypothetical protein
MTVAERDGDGVHAERRGRRRRRALHGRDGGFDSASAGSGKPVTVSGLTLTGAAAGNLHAGADGGDDRHDHGGESDGDGDGGAEAV